MPDIGFILVVALMFAAVGGLLYLGRVLERRKREAFQAAASQLGLTYNPEMNYGLAKHYEFLGPLRGGNNRYASHILTGRMNGHEITAFDYHYETYSTDSKGNRTTHHFNHSVFIVTLPKSFPKLTIGPEGVLSKIAQAFGYDDIDFESAEFSRAYCVRSSDKRFAYDICHSLAIEFLLANRGVAFEIDQTTLASVDDGSLRPDEVESGLQRVLAFRELMPKYLLSTTA